LKDSINKKCWKVRKKGNKQMPKILFIQPTQYGYNGKLCKQNKINLPGLVFPLLASMTPKNWEIEIQLEVVDDINTNLDVDIVGIGTMGTTIFRGAEIAQKFRRRGILVVMGGYMASLVPNECLKYVDSVIIGDAEISYPKLLKDYEKTGKIKPIYDNPISSLDGLPVPDYSFLINKPIGNMLPVQAGRGCSYTCSFCSISCIYKGKYFSRPVNEVVNDIKEVKSLGFKRFYLIDDNIVANPDYLEKLCEKIKPLRMKWSTQCTLNLARNKRLLKIVKEAGAEIMSFGIESISQEGLDKLNKSWLKVDDHYKNIEAITKAGIMISSEMILGTDSDTVESIKQTYKFIMDKRIPIPRFYILTPVPGTQLFKDFKREGRLVTQDYSKYDGSQCVYKPARMPPEKLTEMYWWLNNKVFSIFSILRRTLFHPNFIRQPGLFLFAFGVNMHYRQYVLKKVPPNIF
jgi:radical SAM superfamily enzyme YgiQ (UPF0313 family)